MRSVMMFFTIVHSFPQGLASLSYIKYKSDLVFCCVSIEHQSLEILVNGFFITVASIKRKGMIWWMFIFASIISECECLALQYIIVSQI